MMKMWQNMSLRSLNPFHLFRAGNTRDRKEFFSKYAIVSIPFISFEQGIQEFIRINAQELLDVSIPFISFEQGIRRIH